MLKLQKADLACQSYWAAPGQVLAPLEHHAASFHFQPLSFRWRNSILVVMGAGAGKEHNWDASQEFADYLLANRGRHLTGNDGTASGPGVLGAAFDACLSDYLPVPEYWN
jgi:hypothetical protein